MRRVHHARLSLSLREHGRWTGSQRHTSCSIEIFAYFPLCTWTWAYKIGRQKHAQRWPRGICHGTNVRPFSSRFLSLLCFSPCFVISFRSKTGTGGHEEERNEILESERYSNGESKGRDGNMHGTTAAKYEEWVIDRSPVLRPHCP